MFLGLQYWEIINVYNYPYKNFKQDYFNTVGPGHRLSDPEEYYKWFKYNFEKNRVPV